MSSNYKVIEELDNRKFEEEDFLNVNTPIEFNELEER